MRRPIGRLICHNIKGLARFSGRFNLEISDEDLHVTFDLKYIGAHIYFAVYNNKYKYKFYL